MAMTNCRECGTEVSTAAAVCPKCGIQNPALGAVVETRTGPGVGERVIHERVIREPVTEAELASRRSSPAKAIAVVVLLLVIVGALAWYFGFLHIAGLPQPRQVQVKY